MKSAKREFVEKYIQTLIDAVNAYSSAEPDFMEQAESTLFDAIIEIRNVFSKELPNIDETILLRSGTGLRDANSVLGILKLFLISSEDADEAEKQPMQADAIVPKIFISHRSLDKKIADIFESFLTSCGVPYSNIFCSSLPGNDIEEKISLEVKENLKSSILNIVLLSTDYYRSAYCQNEAGIIWFLDVTKLVVALPEIDDNLMEGFLNNEHKIRRLDSKSDISAICDIVKRSFPNFITSNAKLNSNIDRLIEQYAQIIKDRLVMPAPSIEQDNQLEKRILACEFSDAELLIFYFFFDTQVNSVGDDLISLNQWINKKQITLSIKDGFESLIDDEIIDYTSGGFERPSFYKMFISYYRELRRLSKKAVDLFEQTRNKYINKEICGVSDNPTVNLIIKGFTDSEILLIKYIMDLQRENLFAGWQSEQEIKMIQNWEEINMLSSCLSKNYSEAISKFEIRKYIEPCAKTSYGNTKEYKIRESFLDSLDTLGQSALDKIQKVMLDSKETELDLPF